MPTGCYKRVRKDYNGLRFHHLTVVEDVADKGNKRHCEFLCDCGNIKVMGLSAVVTGVIHSCGCLQFKKIDDSQNIRKTRIYRLHRDMKTRCNNPKSLSYPNYGGKGVEYDKSWENFDQFHIEIGDSYFEGASLDRIDPKLGYSKGNCRWVLPELQGRNKGKLSNNSSGINGVRWDEKQPDGWYAVCHWYPLDGKKKQKSFSAKKYGKEVAFAMACAYREKMIAELNEQGAGYSINHGK